MHSDAFTQLSLVLAVAAGVAMLMRRLRQPLIMGHILTGILVGPTLLSLIQDKGSFGTFSSLGITLLLFIIGLELSISVVKRLGKPVILTAAAILSTVGVIGVVLGLAFGFSRAEAAIMGLALFFSSTIIIAKVLSDKKELTRLNGQIAIGIILLDDVVATFALLFVSAAQGGNALGPGDIGLLILKGIAVVAMLAFVSARALPLIMKGIASSQELLFLFALAWGFGIATLISYVGFSVEVGALFAGVALAHLPYAHQIGAKLKPLRDFFVILFFISLGESLNIRNLAAGVVPALVLSAVVIILKPVVVMASLGALGYTRHTGFKTGVNLSQISEFSIILVVLAQQAGLVGDRLSAIVTLIAIVTIAVSTYLMQYDDRLYAVLKDKLSIFERSVTSEAPHHSSACPLILFGFQNVGHQFLRTFRGMNERYVVVDHDPDVIEDLEHRHVHCLYGDATDPELLDELGIEQARLVVNAVGRHNVNKAVARYVRAHNQQAVLICYSSDHNEAAELYDLGASYVVVSQFIGSQQLNAFIEANGLDKSRFDAYREQHLAQLGEMVRG